MRVSTRKRGNPKGYSQGRRIKGRLPFIQRLRNPAWLLGWTAFLLLTASGIVYYAVYHQGDIAGQNARELMTEYNKAISHGPSPSYAATFPATAEVSPSAGMALLTTTGIPVGTGYVQPSAPDVNLKAISISLPGFDVLGKLTIGKIGLELPVISKTSAKGLKVSICWYSGALPGEPGNMVITGHNFANGTHFGKLNELAIGDEVVFMAIDGKAYTYAVYEKQVVTPDNVKALDKYEGEYALTMITCESSGNRRLIVRCKKLLD